LLMTAAAHTAAVRYILHRSWTLARWRRLARGARAVVVRWIVLVVAIGKCG
jgi:hypothetical protein